MPYKAILKTGELRKRPKPNYAVTNAHEYNESLQRRGQPRLKVLFINDSPYQKGVSGQSETYSNAYLELIFMFYRLFGWGMRQITGHMQEFWALRGHRAEHQRFRSKWSSKDALARSESSQMLPVHVVEAHMDEQEVSLQERLVVGRKRDGRRQYDEAAKEEFIQACLRLGASIARTAMKNGVNPNLVRSWISARQRRDERPAANIAEQVLHVCAEEVALVPVATTSSVFAPVLVEPASPPGQTSGSAIAIAMHVRLPNGVEFDLGEASLAELIVQMLGKLPCSGSTTA